MRSGITGRSPSLSRAWFALVVLALAAILGITDRQMLTLAIEPLKRDLHLDDTGLGVIVGFGPILFSALASPLLGWLADRVDRRWLLVVCVLVWSAGTALCGLVTQGWMLFLCTLTLAVGEAGLGPVVYSLLPDLFPPRLRTAANTLFFAVALFGAGLGIAGAGAIFHLAAPLARALTVEPWRLAFVLVALPGLVVAALLACVGHPPRGGTQAGHAHEASRETLAHYWRRSGAMLTCLILGYAMAAFYVGAILGWAPVALIRDFHVDLAKSGLYSGIAVGGGSALGLLASVLIVRGLRARSGAGLPVAVGCAMAFVAAILLFGLSFATSATMLLVCMTGIIAAYIAGTSLTPTLLQDIAPPHLRGRVIGTSSLVTYMFQAVSVPAVGAISDALHGTPGALLKGIAWLGMPAAMFSMILLGVVLRMFRGRFEPRCDVSAQVL
ncbi:MFS transporter [Burkholderia stabilis]|uniref:D-galactarate permease,putative sialic acid transporter,Arabinose efflux permease,D-galactonate transporter,Major Facilitator Superfamily n=1 Tax=Burkholderia stabilis TaxID=95485 RepID=A0AAJ5NEU3_9BURK|nr:MFS transporter [Burkholderia stabilis]VBB14751.1 D-galactarate permease,putative sialic acid transporter,Arabinose efflux permease,D-galactonate transporter,Major Facilitator Superfamily [Burkholderia stabilis]